MENSLKIQKKFKFSQEEDRKLINLVGIYGNDWFTIAQKMEGRNVRQCRERWRYYLDPSLKRIPWTDKDDELLLQKVKEMGNKWKAMTKFFPNRTYITLKNRYATLSRKLSKYEKPIEIQKLSENQKTGTESILLLQSISKPVNIEINENKLGENKFDNDDLESLFADPFQCYFQEDPISELFFF